ncbi:hypothetical protein [Roseomonas indoligenes]|uniref:Uncharacterized protein n=1 Tax=Roseomonas indoligenes TaxID=2820811 RepID=A0A940MYW6_9PROT|nr:hypothetical protein [Pararoseomonas indoligenes]MBP0493605.1 hypothetical protein [Pararoseomonas indoligenes]
MSDHHSPKPAPTGPFVRIKDLSGGNGDEPVEDIRGFATAADAATFARRYVRDSVERCRTPGADADAVLAAWFAFGEDAEALDLDGEHWTSAAEVRGFAEKPPRTRTERDWRALDPRRHLPNEDDDSAGEEEGE